MHSFYHYNNHNYIYSHSNSYQNRCRTLELCPFRGILSLSIHVPHINPVQNDKTCTESHNKVQHKPSVSSHDMALGICPGLKCCLAKPWLNLIGWLFTHQACVGQETCTPTLICTHILS